MAAANHLVYGFALFHRLASLLSGRTDKPTSPEKQVSESGLSSAAKEHRADPPHASDQQGLKELTGLTKTEAEALLDQLQAAGCEHFEVAEATNKGFTVRFKPPAHE